MEIKKLEDVVTWIDNAIIEMRKDFPSLTEEEFENLSALTPVKEFEAVKEVVKNAIKRHAVYTSALKNDYANLKELMDTKYISIDEHNDICKVYKKKIAELEKSADFEMEQHKITIEKYKTFDTNLIESLKINNEDLEERVRIWNRKYLDLKDEFENYKKDHEEEIAKLKKELEGRKKTIEMLDEKVERQRENLNALNKTVEIRNKEKECLINVRNNQDREIEAHEEENARLSEKIARLKEEIEERKNAFNDLKEGNETVIEKLKNRIDKLETDTSEYEVIIQYQDIISDLNEEKDELNKEVDKLNRFLKIQEEFTRDWKNKYVEAQKEIDELESNLDEALNELKNKERDDHGRAGFEEYIKYIIEEEEGKFKKELNERFSEEVSKISQKRTEEALAKVKGKGGIPCGEDAIE